MTLRQNIRRALMMPCTSDILGHFRATGFGLTQRTAHRARFGRLLDVLLELRHGTQTNAAKLARLFRCTPKSIQRDLDYLRAEGFAIDWDDRKQTYRLEDASRHPWLTQGTR